MRVAAMTAAIAVGVVSLGCGGAQAPRANGRQVILVSADDSVADVARKAYAAAGGGQDCLLVWGDVVTQPEDATSVRLVWASLEHIDGYVLCGDDAGLVLLDPRARHVAMLYYRDRQLHVGHPTDGGTVPLRRTTIALTSDGPSPCLGVFDPNSSDGAPAFVVFRHLREVPRDFLIAAMPLDDRVGTGARPDEAAAK